MISFSFQYLSCLLKFLFNFLLLVDVWCLELARCYAEGRQTRNNTANRKTQTLGVGLGWALEVCNYSSSDRIIAKSAAETERAEMLCPWYSQVAPVVEMLILGSDNW
jgi:hypothetical protein